MKNGLGIFVTRSNVETAEDPMQIEIDAIVARKIGFASHQNAVPVLRELEVRNKGGDPAADLVVVLSAAPPFLQEKTWRLDELKAGSTLYVTDRDVKLNPTYLSELSEGLVGHIQICVTKDGLVVASEQYEVDLLAKNEWGGANAMPELLAAFSMPNEPAIDRLLKAASEVLRSAGKEGAIAGYVDGSRSRTWEIVSAVWSAIGALELTYVLPPSSFEAEGQKIRTPSAILEGRVATCLDTTLLFAAVLEQAGLNPLIILTRGHAFTGVWLQPQEFPYLITDEASAVRKRIDLQEMLVFETTLVTKRPLATFSESIETGKRQILDETFVLALDVRRARMQRIRPLAVLQAAVAMEEEIVPVLEPVLEEAPLLPPFDVEMEMGELAPSDKVAYWQRKLLDLTTRNRLLHLPETSKCVPLLCPDPGEFEDRLAKGRRIKVCGLPDLSIGGRDPELYHEQNREVLLDQYAHEARQRGEVLSTLPDAKLQSQLVDLYRKSRSDLNEGGANTLFLAAGFLKWKKSAADPRIYRAPLILLPIKLERQTVAQGVAVRLHEDEPRFNLTLLELFRQDFGLQIPALEGPLPGDENGVDVVQVWNLVRQVVRDIPTFEVVEDLVIATFSFAKHLMWKDLIERREQLAQSPVVRHLMEGTGNAFAADGSFPRPENLDEEVDPAELFVPLAADSSQLAAVVASARGCNFVLDGPPGTGKSQTIANMIAHNLALGRRVLFVAEKMAALEVVYRRLEEKGLGVFCLELHSNKTSKLAVLKQLERAWDTSDKLSSGKWKREATELRRLRDRLNELVALLHQRRANGMSLHEAIGRVVRDGRESLPKLFTDVTSEHDAATLTRFREVVRRLDLNRPAYEKAPLGLRRVEHQDWSNAWQGQILAVARELPERIGELITARDALLAAVRLPVAAEDEAGIQGLLNVVKAMLATHREDLRFAFSPDAGAKFEAAVKFAEALSQYRNFEKSLSASYAAEAVRRIRIEEIESAWATAASKFWLFKFFAKKKVSRLLAEQGGVAGDLSLEKDLPILKSMRSDLEEIDRRGSVLNDLPGYAALASDVDRMRSAVKLAERLRETMAEVASSPEQLLNLRKGVQSMVVDANEMLGSGGVVASSVSDLEKRLHEYQQVVMRFYELSGMPPQAGFAHVLESAEAIVAYETHLKPWCDWVRVRNEAVALDLSPIVGVVEAGKIKEEGLPAVFETAYARWFASGVIDAEPRLRQFVPAEHLSDIEQFRLLDDRVSTLSVQYIRAKLCEAIPPKNEVTRKEGFGILKHELQKQRRHKPLRQLASEMGESLTRLAPCMLMSPLSIAQYLPPDQVLFDLVIFDEASQIAPWDAIGSIARGKQVVIGGDPRQMPPTSFFNRAAEPEEDDVEGDMESILDECLASGVPSHRLSWHYRSRHESLIAFSNQRYYDGQLLTFPAAVTRESAVEWRRIEGIYAKGKERTNRAEAEAMVDEAVKRLKDPSFGGAGKTLAIVTLNAEQQELVENLLDEARKQSPEIEPYFREDLTEPVVVKNLETVQGDERDLIMLGIGYGPTEQGSSKMSMNFGPLNRDGGWRRLNVAVTRARREMLVFTSFDPSMIDLNRTSARAVIDLKHFVEFAGRGPRALAEAVDGNQEVFASPFEEAVARGLQEKGWTLVPHIGVSRFRLDLGIVHPDREEEYLVGIECDGLAYQSAATARDRDKVREGVLRGLGWDLLRVWAAEWWVDPSGALERLHQQIQKRLEASRQKEAVKDPGP